MKYSITGQEKVDFLNTGDRMERFVYTVRRIQHLLLFYGHIVIYYLVQGYLMFISSRADTQSVVLLLSPSIK